MCLACFLVSDGEGEPHVQEIDNLKAVFIGLYDFTCVLLDGEHEEEEEEGRGGLGGRKEEGEEYEV